MPEKFCLKWNDFQDNVKTVFSSLRKDIDFTDVTLACEDGNQVEAHKVILATSSPFFQNLLRRNKHIHPIIYMRGMKSEDLVAIVDFLYYGEANIYQDNLDTFLNIAEELQLKGLSGGGEQDSKIHPEKITPHKNPPEIVTQNSAVVSTSHSDNYQPGSSLALDLTKQEFPEDIKKLDEKIETMIGRSVSMIANGNVMIKAYICKICGKEGRRSQIKEHIEANHLEGISIPCNLCEKILRSRSGLKKHNSKHHQYSK